MGLAACAVFRSGGEISMVSLTFYDGANNSEEFVKIHLNVKVPEKRERMEL